MVVLIYLVYFGENDCLSLELNIYKNLLQRYFWKPFIIWFCIFNFGYVTSQSLKYSGIHDSHFEYIQTTVTSLFQGWFRKNLHENKWLAFKALYSKTYLQFILRSPLRILNNYCIHHGGYHFTYLCCRRSRYWAKWLSTKDYGQRQTVLLLLHVDWADTALD